MRPKDAPVTERQTTVRLPRRVEQRLLLQAKADLANEIRMHQQQVKQNRAPLYRSWVD